MTDAHKNGSLLAPFRDHPTPMVVMETKTGKILEANDSFCTHFDIRRVELPGSSIYALGRFSETDPKLLNAQKTGSVHLRCCATHKCVREYRMDVQPIEGSPQRLLATLFDMSSMCLAEEQEGRPDHCAMAGAIPAVLFQAVIDNGRPTFTFLTENVSRFFGVERSEIMKDPGSMPVHPEDRDELRRSIAEAAREGKPWKHECRAVRGDGEIMWWRGEASLYMTSDDQSFYNGLLLDVTQEKRVEEALRKQARLLQSTSDASAALLSSFDPNEAIHSCLSIVGRGFMVQRSCLYEISYNRQTEQSYFSLLERWSEREEWLVPDIGTMQDIPFNPKLRRWYEHFRNARPVRGDISEFPAEEQEILAAFGATSLMAIPVMRDGTCWGFLCLNDMNRNRVWTDDEAAAGAAIGNTLAGAIEFSRLLEKQTHAEILYRSIFEDSPAGIFQATPEGKYIRVNQTMARIHGYDSPQEMQNSVAVAYREIYASERDQQAFQQAISELRTIEDMEVLARRKDGSTVWTSRTIHPLVNREGQITGIEGFVVDISERKKLESLREEMERITRHDLKTPLAGFISVPQVLLMSDNLTDEQRELVEDIMDSGRRMLRLINTSLDLYKLERGTYELQPTRVDLLQTAASIRHELRHLCGDRHKQIVVRVDGATQSREDEFIVHGEELLLYSMLANLMKNAVEASPSGATVIMNLVHEDDYRRIDIHNQGTVPEDIRDSFFDKLSTSGKTGGTGLGTYSAKLLAEAHGGSISMRTSEAEGTTVSVVLPAQPGQG